MLGELLGIVPPWLLVGTVIGLGASVVVALLFVVGNWISPTPAVGGAHRADRSGTHVPGDVRRIREIRAYLTAIDERFHEDHEVSGVQVPFYLPERGVAITFNAREYFRLERDGVFAILCEHEMPGRGLGRRLPFEVNEPEWHERETTGRRTSRWTDDRLGGNAQSRRAIEDAFDVLGLSSNATAADVRRAYRERVKRVHPDQGGNEEEFRELQDAYATARNYAEGGTRAAEPTAGFGR
ncbi:J domain-containing protein [Halorubrum vacuolatum]|uniref:DnaJ domain-containing protein n=1 Tax=Halorubrum vacuolatum TaxID=63740 RepID=A0A238UNE5_HALVU|nr:J domain-containing protein [Halorubrum vacuolatum]SNR23023.1 DnaJ domain-containing protein [Halorubrum vacuolatum]